MPPVGAAVLPVEKPAKVEPIDAPEAEEPAPESAQPQVVGQDEASEDAFPMVPSAPKEDPILVARRKAVGEALFLERNTYRRRHTTALVALDYLTKSYASSTAERVKVMKAAEDVLLDFFKIEALPKPE